MAARTTAPVSNVQYEELRPKSEWKEENAANVLRIHLPDFKKEQMKITYVHSTRIIRVTGERQILGTKWARFNQTFAVPQNCEVNNIHARFADGILTITLPKQQESKLQPQATPTKPSSSSQEREEAAATATATASAPVAAAPKPAIIPAPPAPVVAQALLPRTAAEGKEQKGGAEDTGKPDVPRATSLREVLKESRPEKSGEELPSPSRLPVPPPPPPFAPPASLSKILDGQEEIGKKRKVSSPPSSSPSPMVAPPRVDNAEGVKKRKEYYSSSTSGTIKEEEEESKGPSCYRKAEETVVGGKMKEVRSMAAAAKKAVKGRLGRMEMGDHQDMQRLVNVGVAVLVIAAVGAYLYYSFRPSSSSSPPPGNYGQE